MEADIYQLAVKRSFCVTAIGLGFCSQNQTPKPWSSVSSAAPQGLSPCTLVPLVVVVLAPFVFGKLLEGKGCSKQADGRLSPCALTVRSPEQRERLGAKKQGQVKCQASSYFPSGTALLTMCL